MENMYMKTGYANPEHGPMSKQNRRYGVLTGERALMLLALGFLIGKLLVCNDPEVSYTQEEVQAQEGVQEVHPENTEKIEVLFSGESTVSISCSAGNEQGLINKDPEWNKDTATELITNSPILNGDFEKNVKDAQEIYEVLEKDPSAYPADDSKISGGNTKVAMSFKGLAKLVGVKNPKQASEDVVGKLTQRANASGLVLKESACSYQFPPPQITIDNGNNGK